MDNFMEELLKRLQSSTNDEYEFQIMEVTKRNDEHKTSLCVRQKGDVIGVNLYMDDLERSFTNNGCNMEVLVKGILHQLRDNLLNTDFANYAMRQLGEIRDYEKVKQKILFRIINEETNKEYLENSVFVPFLDFAICFYLLIDNGDDMGTIHLTKELFDFWNVSVTEVYQQAMKNTPILLPYMLKELFDMLAHMMPEEAFGQFMNTLELAEERKGIWILSNERMMFGTGTILYEGLMKEISEKIGAEEIVILPSSVNECILLPMNGDVDTYYLRGMVHEVNATQVSHEDRLSDNIYLYSRETNKITVLTE